MSQENDAKKTSINHRNETKALNTLMGIVSGIICDSQLVDSEISYLLTWMKDNDAIRKLYPANIIYRRINEVIRDGVITEQERSHLLAELKALSGNDFSNTGSAIPEHISSVFDDDPLVVHKEKVFVLTGGFLYGTRKYCHETIKKNGGITDDLVTKKTNYLVVGSTASPDWIVANFGKKIQKAAEMAASGDYEISIIREADWVMSLAR